MAKLAVAHHPELTVDDAMEVFRKHFAGKYDVYKTNWLTTWPAIPLNWHFVVKKDGLTGIGVRLKQRRNATAFALVPFTPSTLLVILLVLPGVIPYFLVAYGFLKPSWEAMEDEITLFILDAPEFK